VICGGVATRRGDFLCTMIVERCFETAEEADNVFGENAATVGGLGSYVGCGVPGRSSDLYVEDEDI
jgi:hypothetical protein